VAGVNGIHKKGVRDKGKEERWLGIKV